MAFDNLSAASAPIREKIRLAHDLFKTWGARLHTDSAIRGLVDRLDRSIRASQKAMVDSGIVSACTDCEEKDGGSCCGAGIENKYDPVLIAMNLLMGVVLPDERDFDDSCFFLGPEGCKLRIRHILCVNFLCLPVQKTLGIHGLIQFQNTIGEEMDTTFLLEETIRKYIRGRSR
jgi:hypothetical protein